MRRRTIQIALYTKFRLHSQRMVKIQVVLSAHAQNSGCTLCAGAKFMLHSLRSVHVQYSGCTLCAGAQLRLHFLQILGSTLSACAKFRLSSLRIHKNQAVLSAYAQN